MFGFNEKVYFQRRHFNQKSTQKNYHLHAWISISTKNNTISKSIFLKKGRLANISAISYALLNLFIKEII